MPCSTLRFVLFTAVWFSLCIGPEPSFAGLIQSAELRFKIQGIPDGVITGVGVTGEATSNVSVVVDAGRGLAGATTPAVSAPHLHVYSNHAGTFSGISPSTIGGNLFFLGDHGLAVTKQTVSFFDWVFGGSTTVTCFPWGLPCRGRPWTVGTTTTREGMTAKGSNNLTPFGAGTLVMVTPTFVLGSGGMTPVIAELELVFVPEPASSTMLLTGVALLAALALRWPRGRPGG